MVDPATMMAVTTALSTIIGGLTGKGGEHGSTYSKKARGTLDQILEDLKEMKGGAQDITQQPGYQQGNEWLMGLFNNPEFFKSFEAPLQRQFEEETVPGLANRFASMGSGGATGSTAFRNQLAREGSNLSTNIAALRGGMMQNAIPQLMQYAQQPFNNYAQLVALATQPTQNTYQPPSGGIFGGITPTLATSTAQMYANQYGNPQNPSTGGRAAPVPGQSPLTY